MLIRSLVCFYFFVNVIPLTNIDPIARPDNPIARPDNPIVIPNAKYLIEASIDTIP